jgi:hypothetical protein
MSSVYVTGAEGFRCVRPAVGLWLIMDTEHDVIGRTRTERLAAVDGRAASCRQAVGLRPHAPGKLARRGQLTSKKKVQVTMTVPLPTASTRWRCTLCGNLTRFDVTRSSKVVEYVHLDLAGEPKVEERDVVSETIESVRCRWCNAVDQVELVDRPGADS